MVISFEKGGETICDSDEFFLCLNLIYKSLAFSLHSLMLLRKIYSLPCVRASLVVVGGGIGGANKFSVCIVPVCANVMLEMEFYVNGNFPLRLATYFFISLLFLYLLKTAFCLLLLLINPKHTHKRSHIHIEAEGWQRIPSRAFIVMCMLLSFLSWENFSSCLFLMLYY